MALKLIIVGFSILKINIVKVTLEKTVSLYSFTQIMVLVQNFVHEVGLD